MKPMQKMPIGSAKYHRPMASTTPVTHALGALRGLASLYGSWHALPMAIAIPQHAPTLSPECWMSMG